MEKKIEQLTELLALRLEWERKYKKLKGRRRLRSKALQEYFFHMRKIAAIPNMKEKASNDQAEEE